MTTLTADTAFPLMANGIRVNLGWMASDHEQALQTAESGDANWMTRAAAKLHFGRLVDWSTGRLIDPAKAARAVDCLTSGDAGVMTGAVVTFDPSVWGAAPGGMPVPDGPAAVGLKGSRVFG